MKKVDPAQGGTMDTNIDFNGMNITCDLLETISSLGITPPIDRIFVGKGVIDVIYGDRVEEVKHGS